MTTLTSSTMIFLGNIADLDTDETDWDNENPDAVLGSHDTLSLIDVTNHDTNDDGVLMDDDAPGGSTDFISYDNGGGVTNSAIDSTSVYNANILLGDGTIMTHKVIVIQASNGDTFLVDFPSEPLDNLKIQSIELTSLDSSNYSGYTPPITIENSEIVCFATGTSIATPYGPMPVERIRVGMKVTTLDHGDQTVRWVNTTYSHRADHHAQITIAKGALGDGLPAQNLRLSPQHRVLIGSRIVERVAGSEQVLAAAKHLWSLPGVTQDLGFLPVQYHHFACDNHEIVFANGTPVETFYAGAQARAALSTKAIQRLVKNIPTLRSDVPPTSARPFIGNAKIQRVLSRHIAHNRPLVPTDATLQSPTVV